MRHSLPAGAQVSRCAASPSLGRNILPACCFVCICTPACGGSTGAECDSEDVIKSVYPYTKQIVDFFLSDNQLEFDTVVAAPYPSEGVWALGFVTGSGLASINERLGGSFVSVFIPTSPMPMAGFTVFLAAERLIPLDITVDEALKVTVSAGVIVPPAESAGELTAALKQAEQA